MLNVIAQHPQTICEQDWKIFATVAPVGLVPSQTHKIGRLEDSGEVGGKFRAAQQRRAPDGATAL
jgi:hypothetical protein